MDHTPPGQQSQGQPQQPPIYIVNQAPAAKSHKLRNIAIGCVVGVGGLALLGQTVGTPVPWNPGSGGGGTTITVPTTTPTPPPPLSHIPPKVGTAAYVGVHSTGNQSWVDVTVQVSNEGDRPVQQLTINLEQKGAALAITDPGGWNGVPNGAQYGFPLGIGATQTVVLRVEQWTPKVPISVVVSGNGAVNDPTIPVVACPVTPQTDGVACTLNG